MYRSDKNYRSFHRDRDQYLWSESSQRSGAHRADRIGSSVLRGQTSSARSAQDQSNPSPYSKPYHSFRRRVSAVEGDTDDQMSTKGSNRLSTGAEDRPKSASTHSESSRGSANDRRNSANEPTVSDRETTGLGSQSPTKRLSIRRLSSNGDIRDNQKTSTDDQSSNGVQIKDRRKGQRPGVVTTEQHDKQKSILNIVRASTRSRPESSAGTTVQTRGHPKKSSNETNNSLPEKARKTFAIPLPPEASAVDKTSATVVKSEANSSLDESSSQSTTPGTPSKRKKRHYRGGTYGLFLSKKRKKLRDKKAKENETIPKTNNTNTEGDESSQSFAANSESDGELEAESSDMSNVEEEKEDETTEAHEEVVLNDDNCEEFVESIEGVIGEHPVLNSEEVSQNGVKDTSEEAVDESVSKENTNEMKATIDGGKRKGRSGRRRPDNSAEDDNLSPISSSHSKSIASKDDSQNSSPNKAESTALIPIIDSTAVPTTNGRPVIQIPSNYVTPNAVHNPNRRTLLRISTAGSVKSGETTGTYLGAEQSKFIIVKEKSEGQLSNCMCSAKPLIDSSQKDVSKGKPLFCQAIDCFDEKLIGCCNQVRLTSLFRSSKRVPYRILCEVHLARLRRHHCCPGCGLFCTQGEFNECFCVKKQIHLFHKKCQIDRPQDPNSQRCVHCSNISTARTVRLEMNGPLTNNTYYLQQTAILKTPKARIAMTKRKGRPKAVRNFDELEEPGIEYTIPATQKILSLAGLPLGPQRKQLEELLTALSADKQSIRLTIQQNKNFYAVAKSGEVDKVLSILAQGFDPNFPFEDNDNETPLHAAASCGHLLVVHLLVQSGANPNVLNKNMTTPLMQAIEHKHNQVVKYLISSGASLDLRGEDGMTSLHIAAKCGNIEAIHYIINSGKINVNLQDEGGWSPLVWATEHKYYNIVKLLVSKGADPNIEDDEENIGLHWAAFSGETNIAFMFLEMGTNVINQTNIHGDTPLHIAARRDNYECVVLLLSRGVDITLMNKNNESPLQCAPKDSESEMALKINQELKRFSVRRQTNSEKLLHRDLSKGKEYYQIQVVNGVDNEPYPIDFMYVTDNCEASQINIDRTITSLQSCQCEDDCTSQKCVCAAISFRCWYDKEGKLLPEFNLMDAPMIFECNRACSCWKSCNNRVVQYGVRSRLQVFRTEGKGWGVRALRDIPKGTFVCEYIGEIISDSEADRREDDSYLFDLDNKDGETYCLDARFYGNICRFINHLCNPNLTPVKVFVDHQDLSFPRIALFSSRDIKAYEELGFDYGEKFWVIKYKTFTCSCGAVDCKYNKDSIHNTIENYYKRLRDEQLSANSPIGLN